ncbi:MAG: hypothetical protein ACRECR_01495 [Thermoplasmata archaeon]
MRAEIETLRRELAEMREEQRQLARTVEELAQTFRAVATHLGIAAEPYGRKTEHRERSPPGFA